MIGSVTRSSLAAPTATRRIRSFPITHWSDPRLCVHLRENLQGGNMPVIDVHTHMLNRQWLALLHQRGAPKYTVSRSLEGQETILSEGAQFLTPMPAHFDYELR